MGRRGRSLTVIGRFFLFVDPQIVLLVHKKIVLVVQPFTLSVHKPAVLLLVNGPNSPPDNGEPLAPTPTPPPCHAGPRRTAPPSRSPKQAAAISAAARRPR